MSTVRLHLVRHGRATAGWGEDPDPGLDAVGRSEAADVASVLADLGPLPILTSPLRRARQTAEPLASRWRTDAVVEPAVGEIPSPTADLAERSAWLRAALRGRWVDLEPAVLDWRARLLSALVALPADAVVFTHFVAINAVVGAASHQEATIVFAPGNGSHTIVEIEAGTLSVVQRGAQAAGDVG